MGIYPQLLSIIFGSFVLSCVSTAHLLKRMQHTKNDLPVVSGIGLWFSFIVTALFLLAFNSFSYPVHKDFLIILVASTMIFLLGVIDDKKELSVSTQFLTQSVIVFFVMFSGVRTQIVGIGAMGNSIVTFLWILGITNAFNHLDIVDGLSAGVAFVCAITFCIVSALTANTSLALFFIALAGSIFGFLKYNFPVARVYMGNAGSHFLGFVLSTFSIMISYATLEKRIALLVPLVILGVPIFDTLFVMYVRTLKRKYFWEKSNDHLVLRLIERGHSKKRAVIFMLFFTLLCSFCAVALLRVSASQCYGIVAILILLFFIIAIRMKGVDIKG